MDPRYRLLIVDDEEDLCEILQFNLEGEGFDAEVAYSAEDALKKDLKSFDLLILDVMMGQMSGFKLAEKLRKELKLSIPIVFITAKNTENDLLTGFNLGGDDYITKPFSIKEVIVRVRAILNRLNSSKSGNGPAMAVDGLELDMDMRCLRIDNNEVTLTKKEFEILVLLSGSNGRILSREYIMDNVWEDGSVVSDRTVDVHITRLRKKMGDFGKHIHNKPGFGYSFKTNC